MGVMGRTHIGAYNAANAAGLACRVVAVSDHTRERLMDAAAVKTNIGTGKAGERLFDPAMVAQYTDPAKLLADANVRLVSICTHTETHADLAIKALAAGKHVLVEKPVAVEPADVRRVVEAAKRAKTLCMPGLCIRFWPAWVWLAARIRDGTLGAVKGAMFTRLGTPPAWSPEFYLNAQRSGGALVDLHIHDSDFVSWCFGRPEAVACVGSLDHVVTSYRCRGGPARIVAEGGWDQAPGFGFRMRYIVVFEKATADFDIGREPQLLLSRDGKVEALPLDPIVGYDGEIRHLLGAIHAGRRELDATVEDALTAAEVLKAERASMERGGEWTRVD